MKVQTTDWKYNSKLVIITFVVWISCSMLSSFSIVSSFWGEEFASPCSNELQFLSAKFFENVDFKLLLLIDSIWLLCSLLSVRGEICCCWVLMANVECFGSPVASSSSMEEISSSVEFPTTFMLWRDPRFWRLVSLSKVFLSITVWWFEASKLCKKTSRKLTQEMLMRTNFLHAYENSIDV